MGKARHRVLLGALAALLASCGSKTGLLIPDASVRSDAGTDAGMCLPIPVTLDRRGAQIFFTLDRSTSMADTLDGRPPPHDPEPSRWNLLGQILDAVLADADPILEIGAKFYPRPFSSPPRGPMEACTVDRGVDLAPARGHVDELLSVFDTTIPGGGTPTAVALGEVRAFIERNDPGVPRFVILATDGGPNCNPDTGIPPTECVCTGDPDACTINPEYGPYNCIDEMRTIDVIRELFTTYGVPVYVIGIDDPTRPDLADVLDEMAIAGGRPRDVAGERRFYSVRRPDDLRGALTTVTDSISRCVFTVRPTPGPSADLDVRVDGVPIARDAGHVEGWDFDGGSHGEVTLFGSACDRVTAGGAITAEVVCPPGE